MNEGSLPACTVSVLAVAYPCASAAASAGYTMTPAQAPLPTDCRLLFHPEAGIHTSILMSESSVGLRVAWTRQNAGRVLNEAAGTRPAPGGVKSPAATVFADAMLVRGIVREARLSQDTGALAAEAITPVSVMTTSTLPGIVISHQYIR